MDEWSKKWRDILEWMRRGDKWMKRWSNILEWVKRVDEGRKRWTEGFRYGGGKMTEKYYWKGYVRVMERYVSGGGDW